jgi:hypothetical protein
MKSIITIGHGTLNGNLYRLRYDEDQQLRWYHHDLGADHDIECGGDTVADACHQLWLREGQPSDDDWYEPVYTVICRNDRYTQEMYTMTATATTTNTTALISTAIAQAALNWAVINYHTSPDEVGPTLANGGVVQPHLAGVDALAELNPTAPPSGAVEVWEEIEFLLDATRSRVVGADARGTIYYLQNDQRH